MDRKINVIEDLDGKKTVFIQDVIFKGRQSIDWDDVEQYLKKYINEVYDVTETGDKVFIGRELPSEYTGSIYTMGLKGGMAKAKANAVKTWNSIISGDLKRLWKYAGSSITKSLLWRN